MRGHVKLKEETPGQMNAAGAGDPYVLTSTNPNPTMDQIPAYPCGPFLLTPITVFVLTGIVSCFAFTIGFYTDRVTNDGLESVVTCSADESEVVEELTAYNQGLPGFPDSQPNIFVVLVDDLGYHDVGFTGAEYPTPAIDELFSEGVRLGALYGLPLCTPSRAAMFTGRFSWKMGMQWHEVLHPANMAAVPLDVPILGEYLQEAGYANHYFGRWALGHAAAENRPLERGYDSFNGFLTLNDRSYNGVEVAELSSPFDGMTILDWWDGEDPDDPDGVYNDEYSYRKILDKLDELEAAQAAGDERPWHMVWSCQTVHNDITFSEPPEVPDLYAACDESNRELYCKRMVYLDYTLNNIFNSIKDKGWWDDSVVVFLTDNGASQADYNDDPDKPYYGSNLPFRGSKGTYYEGGIRLLSTIGGGWIPDERKGTVNVERHHISDITTTLADVAQSKLAGRLDMDGKNIFFDDHNDHLIITLNPLTEITWLPLDPLASGTVVFWGEWKYIAFSLDWTPSPTHYITGWVDPVEEDLGLYDETWDDCYVTTGDGLSLQSGCLYNIHDDPMEETNVWDQYPDVIRDINGLIAAEFYGPNYNTGQNMEKDYRAYTVNLMDPKMSGSDDGLSFYIGAWLNYTADKEKFDLR